MTALWFEAALLPDGWADGVRMTLSEGRIATIERDRAPEAADARHGAALPGLCNLHSHGFQRGMAGLGEVRGRPDDDFWSWREVMYRFLDRLTPEDVTAITAQAYVEMIEGGYTRVGEFHYLHHAPDGGVYGDRAAMAAAIVEAARTSGIGLTLLPVFYAHGGFGGAAPSPGQRRFLNDLDEFAALVDASEALLGPDDRIGIAPHSLRAVTPEQLAVVSVLRPDAPVHIHAAEQVKEVEGAVAALGARPVEWLLGVAGADARWCLIHATHLTDAEADSLAASGAVAGLCPVTEANLGDGTFPAMRYLEAGGRIGTGTDSNVLIDAAGELRQLEYSQRLHHRRRALLADGATASVGRSLFDAAGAGAAQALAWRFGLAEGAPADFFTLDCGHPALAGKRGDALIDGWVFAARAPAIDGVWRGGVQLVREGRHVRREAVAARYRQTLATLLA